jgi:hypothetical protein
MKTKHIIDGIIFVGLAACAYFFYVKYTQEIDRSLVKDQKISRMQDDLNNAYSELGQTFGGSQYGSERDNQILIHKEVGGEMEYRLPSNKRVDLVFETRREGATMPRLWACEIDWAYKAFEGIGQARYYSIVMRKNSAVIAGRNLTIDEFHMPLVILLAKGRNSKWRDGYDIVKTCGMSCSVWDAEKKDWIIKEH